MRHLTLLIIFSAIVLTAVSVPAIAQSDKPKSDLSICDLICKQSQDNRRHETG